ncbi:MAG: hypothetical protein CMM42_02870 [Rhodospirillaceae bacterium]|nr:hypothetical protein [Rhodospirillaceae bacterium]|tara:strand:- start:3643 stop:4023 length:381 start_codon:yes stop_codon:yes gene_type:complete
MRALDSNDQKTQIIDAFIRLQRFIAVVNGGGVAATVTIIGATSNDGDVLNWLALPLGCFALGLISILMYSGSQFFTAVRANDEIGPNLTGVPTWVTANLFQHISGWSSLSCFIAGCAFSVAIVALG